MNPRLYAILDAGYVPPEPALWATMARALIAGGADWVEMRAKGVPLLEQGKLLEAIRPICLAHRIPLIINDELELAQRYPELGLHVGQDDLDPQEARQKLGPERILGLSTHSVAQAEAAMALPAGVLSYFAVGPVYATATKPTYEPVGLELVHYIARQQPALPWFAIGGVNRRTLLEVVNAGATRVVVVSDILLDPDPTAATQELKTLLLEAS